MVGREIWQTSVPGFTAHGGQIHASSDSLLVADGWGAANARLRRFDLRTGEERASSRTGTAIRCMAFLPGDDELIGASDTKLFKLGIRELDERRRWDRRIPRYSNSIAVRDVHGVVANWKDPRVSIVDLDSGKVRYRNGPSVMLVLDGSLMPLLVGGSREGGLYSIDPKSATVRLVGPTPPSIDAVVAPDRSSLWSTVGVRGTSSDSSVSPGPPTRILRRMSLSDGAANTEFTIPIAVKQLRFGRSDLWLAGADAIVALPLPVGSAPARTWRPPSRRDVRWFEPDMGIAIVVNRDLEHEARATLSAFALS